MLEPKGSGFVAKVWTIWPSTDVEELWPKVHSRIVAETLPALEVMTNRPELITALENSVGAGPIYIRAREYAQSHEMIRILRRKRAYS